MRPRPSEIISGIRATLAEVIAPELTSDHARSRLADIRAVLAQVDWDDVAFAEKARAIELAERLREAAEWVSDTVPQPPGEESLRSYEEFSDRVAVIATGAIERLAAHLDQEPDDGAARQLYRRLLESL